MNVRLARYELLIFHLLGSCIALGYLSFLVLMGGQLLVLQVSFVGFLFSEVCSIPQRVSSSWVCCWSVWKLKRLRHCRSRRDGMSNAWARRRHIRWIWASATGGGWGGAIHQVGWCFWCGPCFCNFCSFFFLEWWWTEWSVKKKSATKYGSSFFSTFQL